MQKRTRISITPTTIRTCSYLSISASGQPLPRTSFSSIKMSLQPDLRVIRIGASDVSRATDHLRAFEKLILTNEDSYPQIKSWLNEKVIEGVKTGERVAFVGYHGSRPAIWAGVKRGKRSKV